MKSCALFLLLFFASPLIAQQVVDQTFKLDGVSEHFYAFAEGDEIQLHVQELTGKKIKSIEFSQYPDNHLLFRAYELDSILEKPLLIPKTGIYLLRFQEVGLSKKICRFTLSRKAGNPETARFDTQLSWDVHTNPRFRIGKKSVQAGRKTEVVSLGGQATVSSKK